MPDKPKWAPGPWTVKPYREWFDVVGPNGEEVLLASAPRTLHPKSPDIERQKANAVIGAAAPELYEALNLCREWLLVVPALYDALPMELAHRITDALAKARGEQPDAP